MEKQNRPFRVIVAGSRDFRDYEEMKRRLDNILSQVQDTIIIVSGTAGGADILGERYAKEKGYSIDFNPAPWREIQGKPQHEIGQRRDGSLYWKRAGLFRNEEMAKNADACVVFRVNNSNGSTHMIEIAKRYNLKLRFFDYK